MHRHVMWALCDVSVVQPLYFGLFTLGSKRGGAKGVSHAQACHVGCV